jgi:hypothetical protein
MERTTMDSSAVLFLFITGILVIALSYFLDRLWAAAVPARVIYLFIRLPGVVLHECAHVLGCLLTGARVRKLVLFSRDGGSVTYTRPVLPYIGDVVISTAPLSVLPLALSGITWVFVTFLGCAVPAFPATIASPPVLLDLIGAILYTFSDNLLTRFNGWFLLYLYLTLSLVLSVAPSTQDMKNAALGSILLILAGMLVLLSGWEGAISLLDELLRLLGYGFTLGLAYGLVALALSLPLLVWYAAAHRS